MDLAAAGDGCGLPSISSGISTSKASIHDGDMHVPEDEEGVRLDELDEVMEKMQGLVSSLGEDSYLGLDAKSRSHDILDIPAHKEHLDDDCMCLIFNPGRLY